MASIALSGTLGSCSFLPGGNCQPNVYGPPPAYDEGAESAASGGYDPEENIEPDVYGPPEMMEDGADN